MTSIAKTKEQNNLLFYIAIIAICLVIFWPLSLQVFSLKNDATTYFLPWRYHISESIQNGFFPYWNPYLYNGLPLHADIQSGAWNPLVLIISLFKKYNMSVLQLETLLYLLIGAIGFFKLCLFFRFHQYISLLLSIAYISNGFFIDSASFIPWITSAAYLPFVFLYFLRLQASPELSNALKFSLSISLMFLAGYPSFVFFLAYILLAVTIGSFFASYKNNDSQHLKKQSAYAVLSAFVALVICSPALFSYVDFFPYYERGTQATLEQAQSNPFHPYNTLSYIFPEASYKLNTNNDISARNAYIGLIPLIFILYSFGTKWNKAQKTIGVLTLLCFLFSLGSFSPVRSFFYHALPFMDSFRHPATMRIFTNGSLLLLAGFGFQFYIEKKNENALAILNRAFFLGLLLCLLYFGLAADGFENMLTTLSDFDFSSASIKFFIDKTNVNGWIVLIAAIHLITISALAFYKKRWSAIKSICFFSIANIALLSWLAMPFTMFSQQTTPEVNAFISSFPKNYPKDLLALNVQNTYADSNAMHLHGYERFYNKKIAVQDEVITPTLNSAYSIFLADSSARNVIASHPFVFFENGGSIGLKSFNTNAFYFEVMTTNENSLTLVQQYNHNWKALLNNKPISIEKAYQAFMQVKIPAGKHQLIFQYRPAYISILAIIAVCVVAAIIIFLIYKKMRSR